MAKERTLKRSHTKHDSSAPLFGDFLSTTQKARLNLSSAGASRENSMQSRKDVISPTGRSKNAPTVGEIIGQPEDTINMAFNYT
jgi:hypothetical protein